MKEMAYAGGVSAVGTWALSSKWCSAGSRYFHRSNAAGGELVLAEAAGVLASAARSRARPSQAARATAAGSGVRAAAAGDHVGQYRLEVGRQHGQQRIRTGTSRHHGATGSGGVPAGGDDELLIGQTAHDARVGSAVLRRQAREIGKAKEEAPHPGRQRLRLRRPPQHAHTRAQRRHNGWMCNEILPRVGVSLV